MRRYVALVLGLLLALFVPVSTLAGEKPSREVEMARTMRAILKRTREPREVAKLLSEQGARFLGYQATQVTFVYDGKQVVPSHSTLTTVGPDLTKSTSTRTMSSDLGAQAGEKTDLTMTMWLYEWQNSDRTFTEQAIISGHWSDTEYSWIDNPADVIDVRWIVGDLVYLSSSPFDGIQRDQHTNGIASFTVDDQVEDWDLFVNFRPVSSGVYGKWTNIFANYTHTWWGVKLSVTLGQGQHGSTGNITVSTDGKQWQEGTGLAFQIGSGQSRGPVYSSLPVPEE